MLTSKVSKYHRKAVMRTDEMSIQVMPPDHRIWFDVFFFGGGMEVTQ